MPEIKVLILCSLVGLLIGLILGHYAFPNKKEKANGQIILDHNDDGDDRIQFVLGLEYEDFKNHKVIVFDVINKEEK